MFNTEEFLNTTSEEVLDDVVVPCPPGDWLAIAGKPEIKDFEFKSGDRVGETGYRMALRWEIQDEEPKEICGRTKVTVVQSVLLDITEDGSSLDFGKGKNVGLGRIRTALGQNTAGAPWSPNMIEGQPAKLNITAGVYNENVTAEIKAVTAP